MRNQRDIIDLAEQFAKAQLGTDSSGHDWWHCNRVRNLALEIAKREQADADLFICELAALLHDVADEKLNPSKQAGLDKVQNWLERNLDDGDCIRKVMHIISNMSYNGGKNKPLDTLEGQIVQDADRLDALGAIGIARTFAYSGWKGQMLHHPDLDFSDEDYRSSNKTAIYHFYEKLLKLKDLMNTRVARDMAEKRHAFMETFLNQFYREWNLEDVGKLDE